MDQDENFNEEQNNQVSNPKDISSIPHKKYVILLFVFLIIIGLLYFRNQNFSQPSISPTVIPTERPTIQPTISEPKISLTDLIKYKITWSPDNTYGLFNYVEGCQNKSKEIKSWRLYVNKTTRTIKTISYDSLKDDSLNFILEGGKTMYQSRCELNNTSPVVEFSSDSNYFVALGFGLNNYIADRNNNQITTSNLDKGVILGMARNKPGFSFFNCPYNFSTLTLFF